MHTSHIHTYVLTYVRTYIHTCTHTYMHAHAYKNTNANQSMHIKCKYHQGASDRPRHCGCVHRIVAEPLGDVDGVNAARVLERAQVEDELVCAAAVLSGEQHLKFTLQARLRVVGTRSQRARSHRICSVRGFKEALGGIKSAGVKRLRTLRGRERRESQQTDPYLPEAHVRTHPFMHASQERDRHFM